MMQIEEMVNRIFCVDCLELMREMPDNSIDMILTDPPYGIKRDEGFEGFEGFGGFGEPIARTQYPGGWDDKRPDKIYFDEIIRISKKAIIFGGNFFADILPQGNHWIVWDKLNTMPTFGNCELIWTNIKRNSVKKYTVEWNGLIGKEKFRYHATQKPVQLMAYLIRDYTEPDALILDPFLGSGTTAVAAIRTGRRFIGCEINQSYVDICNKRINAELAQLKLDF